MTPGRREDGYVRQPDDPAPDREKLDLCNQRIEALQWLLRQVPDTCRTTKARIKRIRRALIIKTKELENQ